MKTSSSTSSAPVKRSKSTVAVMTESVATNSTVAAAVTTPSATVQAAAKTHTISSPYQLQKRVMLFAVSARAFVEKLPKQLALSEDARHFIRASGELGMHAIDADEAPSKKAFIANMQFCKKGTKEVLYWLQLLDRSLTGFTERRRQELYKEAHELRRIFHAIVKTSMANNG